MAGIVISGELTDFNEIKESELVPLVSYDLEPVGQTTEAFISNVLKAAFDGVVMPVPSGSKLDKRGIDMFIKGTQVINGLPPKTLGIQVKSSEYGCNKFTSHDSEFYKQVIVLWVNINDWKSRLALYKGLRPLLNTYGIGRSPYLKQVLKRRKYLLEKNVKCLKVHRGIVPGLSSQEVNLLCALGISHMEKGYFYL